MFFDTEPDIDPMKGMLAGAIGGFAGSIAMNVFHAAVENWQEMHEDELIAVQDEGFLSEEFIRGMNEEESSAPPPLSRDQYGETAPAKAASAVSEKVTGRPLSEKGKQIADPVVHYGFGSLLGMFYGVSAEYMPMITYAEGAAFGASVMLATEESTVPALRLTPSPRHHRKSVHLYSLISHIIYGLTCEAVRKHVRRLLE